MNEILQIVQPVSFVEVISFVSVFLVPAIVDVLRVGTFQIALRLKNRDLAYVTTTSKFGLAVTMFTSVLAGLVISVLFGITEATIPSIGQNALMILGVSQLIYKGGYEKSVVRKAITATVDKIGEGSTQVDLPDEQVPFEGTGVAHTEEAVG